MAGEEIYGIGFFVAGDYHILSHEGEGYQFQNFTEYSALRPVKMTFQEARAFIDTHPVCTNISLHDVRIMPYQEIENILQGKSPQSTVKSLELSGEEPEEERLR